MELLLFILHLVKYCKFWAYKEYGLADRMIPMFSSS